MVPMPRSPEADDGTSSEPPRSAHLSPMSAPPVQQPPPSCPWTSAIRSGKQPTVPLPIARTSDSRRMAVAEAEKTEAEARAATSNRRLVWAEFPNPCGIMSPAEGREAPGVILLRRA
jgi:hypothetical protein